MDLPTRLRHGFRRRLEASRRRPWRQSAKVRGAGSASAGAASMARLPSVDGSIDERWCRYFFQDSGMHGRKLGCSAFRRFFVLALERRGRGQGEHNLRLKLWRSCFGESAHGRWGRNLFSDSGVEDKRHVLGLPSGVAVRSPTCGGVAGAAGSGITAPSSLQT